MRRAGMTLMELVVALTITVMILAAGYAAFGTAIDRRQVATAILEKDLAAASVRSSIESWLAGIRLPGGSSQPVFNGADGTFGDEADDEITFLTSAPTPLGDGLALVSLYVDRDSTTVERGLVAEVSAWMGSARTRIELIPDAVGLDVRYRSRLLGGRDWHPSWISSSILPMGVELRIRGSGSAPLHPLLTYPIRVPIQGGR